MTLLTYLFSFLNSLFIDLVDDRIISDLKKVDFENFF